MRYESVFAHASFQFCGHIDEYLIKNTRRLLLLRFQTRFGKGGHRLERYEEGRLIEERKLCSSRNVFLYYLLMFIHHTRELWRFARDEKTRTVAFFTHPIGCFGMLVHRLFHKVRYVFWVWDWFPPRRLVLKVYALVVRFYARRVDCSCALTEAIAKEIGGNVRVAMLGMSRLPCAQVDRAGSRKLLVVGQLRHGQGIEEVLDFIGSHSEYSLALMGAAAAGFERDVLARIEQMNITERVYFPNRFVTQDELSAVAAECFCGLALYDTGGDNFTHYADPGKVKSYLEMGLPVVMTRISNVVSYVERFKAGEVIASIGELSAAVARIKAEPHIYTEGVRVFTDHFEFQQYYNENLGGLLR